VIRKDKLKVWLKSPWFAMVLFVGLMLSFLNANINEYMNRHLGGNLDGHALSSAYFGAPAHVKAKGYEPFFKNKDIVGWDGQFYYYIANDIFDRKNSNPHFDAPAYRWQRVGFGMWASTLSTLMGHDWVSPRDMIDAYVLLYVLGLCALFWIYHRFQVPKIYLVLWPMAVMTQITIMNGLPDAAADAFIFIALFFLFKDWLLGYVLFMSLGVLSREGYILLAFCLFAGALYELFKQNSIFTKKGLLRLTQLALPGVVFLGWQVWIRLHFKISPAAQAPGIVDIPFKGWSIAFAETGVVFVHLSLFLALFFITYLIWLAYKMARKTDKKSIDIYVRSIIVGLAFLCLLYYCFGHTVTMHWSGYLKPIPFLLALTPLVVVALKEKFTRTLQVMMVLITLTSLIQMYREKLGLPFLN
jgi:hypothetical protein